MSEPRKCTECTKTKEVNGQLILVRTVGQLGGKRLSSDVADGVREGPGPTRLVGPSKEDPERGNCARGGWADLLQDEDRGCGVIGIAALVGGGSGEDRDCRGAYFSEDNPTASSNLKVGGSYEEFPKSGEGWAGVWPERDEGPKCSSGAPHSWAVKDDGTDWFDFAKPKRQAAPELVPRDGIVVTEPMEEDGKGVGPHEADCFRGLRLSGRGFGGLPGSGEAANPIVEGLSFVRWFVNPAGGDQDPSCQPDRDNDKQGLLPGLHVVIVIGWVGGLNSKLPVSE